MAKATAPYNFVSLPDKPLKSEIAGVANFKEHILNCERLSGEIILDIESLTPLFIGGNPKDETVTFSPQGTPIIAGSSLRGMFKNMLKIVTCGTFRGRTDSQKKGEDFNDEHIYFRCIMGTPYQWMKSLNKVYNDRMVGEVRGKDGKLKPAKNARPGFLIQMTNGKYFIAPSIYEHDRKVDKIFIKEYQEKFNHGKKIPIYNGSCIKWHGETAYIITGGNKYLYDSKTYETLSDKEKKKAGKQFIRFTKLSYVDWSREHWIELPDDVRESYEHDRNKQGVDLLTDKGILNRDKLTEFVKNLPTDIQTLVPCHFLYEKNQVTAFGHGQCFRIPYKNSIGDLVPDALKIPTFIDFADAIFGREKFWASRVYFEDAVITKNLCTLEKDAAHPLMQPKPTSYQLYLNQKGVEGENLNHWDKDGAKLRGYKLYWHSDFADWKATADERKSDAGKSADKRITKTITPLKKGATFKAKIRFQNLSAVELGALMMIFDLNGTKNSYYKIGMGKSLGLGSIKVTPTLYLESNSAYENIFDGNGWKNPYEKANPAQFLDIFKKYVDAQKMTSIWQNVMKELNAILDWEKKPSQNKIQPMGNEPDEKGNMQLSEKLRKRAPLPTIFEVLK